MTTQNHTLVSFNKSVATAVATMVNTQSVVSRLQKSLTQTMLTKIIMREEFPHLEAVKPTSLHLDEVEFKEYIQAIFPNNQEARTASWRYRDLEKKKTALKILLGNDIESMIKNTLEGILKAILKAGTEEITLSQAIDSTSLDITSYEVDGEYFTLSKAGESEIKLALINEMAEMDILDIRLGDRIHFVSFRNEVTNQIPHTVWDELKELVRTVYNNTVLTSPKTLSPSPKDLISHSSWSYETPELSGDIKKFVQIMHNIKWEFVPNAENMIEDRFRKHLRKDGDLLDHELIILKELKEQISLSRANNGHYCSGHFDSALRWYWEQSIGHNQTSSSLRSLVRVQGINNPVKYDMVNNVVQMYSLALSDKQLASYVGLVSPQECGRDLRERIAIALNKTLNVLSFEKDNIKPIFMQWAYNGGKELLLDGHFEEQRDPLFGGSVKVVKVKGLKEIARLGGSKYTDEVLWEVWNKILWALVPSIVALKDYYRQIVSGNQFHLAEWVLPDGAKAQYASVKTTEAKLTWVTSGGKKHSHTHHYKALSYGEGDAGLLPRMVHSIDAYVMRQIVLRANRLGIVIVPNHDSFTFSKEHYPTILGIVREVYVEVLQGHILGNILKQFNKNKIKPRVEFPDITPLKPDDIMASFPMKLEED